MARKDIEQAIEDVKAFDQSVANLTLDRANEAKKEETELQVPLSTKEIEKSKDIYLKPNRAHFSVEKFNEKFRKDYEHEKEYVYFIAENKEVIGEDITIWTKPFAGLPAEEWIVPVNKPIWGPRYLAEQISRCNYHILTMQKSSQGSDHAGQYYGQMVADKTVSRLEARSVNAKNKNIFLGAAAF